MIDKIDKFEDLYKRLKRNPCKCSQCGRLPVLKTSFDDMGWRHFEIECECGLRIPVGFDTISEMLDNWERVNAESFTPREKAFDVGIPRICNTCHLKGRCTEYAGMRPMDRKQRRCSEWILDEEDTK